MNSFEYQYPVRQHLECGKDIVDFGGIMPNPTYVKVQEGAKIARENHIWNIWYEKHQLPTKFIPMGAVVTLLKYINKAKIFTYTFFMVFKLSSKLHVIFASVY